MKEQGTPTDGMAGVAEMPDRRAENRRIRDLATRPSTHNDVRPFATGMVVGIGSGLLLGSVVVGVFGSDLSMAVHHLVRLILRSDDSVDFEQLLQ